MTKYLVAVLLFIFSAITQFACAQSAAQTTVHRKNVGATNENKWIRAESTEGKFAVDLPSPFNDITISDQDSSSVLKVFLVGTTTSDNIRFLATRVSYRISGYAALVFKQLEKGEGIPGKIVGIETLQHQGFKAVNIMTWKPDTFLSQLTLLVGEETVTLIIEGPIEKIDSLNTIADHFINSLNILQNH